jgi:hypothetical protein
VLVNTLSAVTLDTALNVVFDLTTVNPDVLPLDSKMNADADNASRRPAPFAGTVNEPEVETVTPAPAVMTVEAVPLLTMWTTCPVVNTDVLTVIVVADAEFMTT